MSYRFAATLLTIVSAVLGLLFIFAPQLYSPTYGVAPDAGAVFITRRMGPVFLGLAWILWVSRGSPVSPLRMAIAHGGAICFVGVALTGIYEWMSGAASPAILIAVVSEFGLAALLGYTARSPQ